MKFLFAALFSTGVLASTHVRAQQPAIQTQFLTRPAWLFSNGPAQALMLDTLANPARQNMPTNYIAVDGYRVVLRDPGEVFVFRPGETMVTRSIYPSEGGGRAARPVAYAEGRLLVITTQDGHLKPRTMKLVELQLSQGTYQVITKGKQIEQASYSPDLSQITFIRDGAPGRWERSSR